MNKLVKIGVPLGVGVAAAAVPIGYVTYVVANPISKDGSEMTRFWTKFDNYLLSSYKIQDTQEIKDLIIEGHRVLLSEGIESEEMTKVIEDFRNAVRYTGDIDYVLNRFNYFDEDSIKINISSENQPSYWINKHGSSEDSPIFGRGYNLSIYDLFDNVIPNYLANDPEMPEIDKTTQLSKYLFLPEDLTYTEFASKYTGGNINEGGVWSEKIYYQDPLTGFEHDMEIRSQRIYDSGTFVYVWFKRIDGATPVSYSFNEEMYNNAKADMTRKYSEQPYVQSIINQYSYIKNESILSKNGNLYGKLIDDLFSTDIYAINKNIYRNQNGAYDNTNDVVDAVSAYNTKLGKTKDAATNIWSPMSIASGAPIFQIINDNFGDVFDNFTSADASSKMDIKVSDIPYFMGTDINQSFSFEYAIASDAKYTNGNLILPNDFEGEERYNTYYLEDQVPTYSSRYLVNKLTDKDIIDIFAKGGL